MEQLEPSTNYLCCTTYKDRCYFQHAIRALDLTPIQKQTINMRYISILENFQKRSRKHSIAFFLGHFMITVGSLFVPALLSIQNSNSVITYGGANFATDIYWSTFIISLLVTMCNALLTLFKIDKKYYFLNTTLERLRSEGWQYVSLTGRYSGHLIGGAQPTHHNQFVFFMHYIEKFKMKQVEEEYYKTDEHSAHPTNNPNATQTAKNELYPPSPDQPIHIMADSVPDPVKEAMNSIIQSQKTIESPSITVPIFHDTMDVSQVKPQDPPLSDKP